MACGHWASVQPSRVRRAGPWGTTQGGTRGAGTRLGPDYPLKQSLERITSQQTKVEKKYQYFVSFPNRAPSVTLCSRTFPNHLLFIFTVSVNCCSYCYEHFGCELEVIFVYSENVFIRLQSGLLGNPLSVCFMKGYCHSHVESWQYCVVGCWSLGTAILVVGFESVSVQTDNLYFLRGLSFHYHKSALFESLESLAKRGYSKKMSTS